MQLRLHKQVWQDNTYFYKKIRNNCIALSLKYDYILRKPSSNLIYIYIFYCTTGFVLHDTLL